MYVGTLVQRMMQLRQTTACSLHLCVLDAENDARRTQIGSKSTKMALYVNEKVHFW